MHRETPSTPEYDEEFLVDAEGDPAIWFESGNAQARLGKIAQLLKPGSVEVSERYGPAESLGVRIQMNQRTKFSVPACLAE